MTATLAPAPPPPTGRPAGPAIRPSARALAARRRRDRRARWAQRLRGEASLVFIVVLVAYLVVAWLLDFVYLVLPGDAVSRTANAYYVLYARDPHLAAIGFVWNPLPSIATMPLLLLKDVWPALVTHNFAGSLVSVVALAGAVHQLRAALQDWGVTRAPRLALTACFAANPMVVYYAANGMSEGLYLCTLMGATRYLLRWCRDDDTRSLVYAGTWLGVAYLARDEVAGAAVAAAVVVAGRDGLAMPLERGDRVTVTATNVAIFWLPFLITFVGWATVSYVITGQAFQQFSSVYGNSSQLSLGAAPVSTLARLSHEGHDLFAIAPGLAGILIVAAIVAAYHHDRMALAPLSVLGGGLAFSLGSYLHGSTFGWFRFYIVAVPLQCLLAGCVVARRRRRRGAAGRRVLWRSAALASAATTFTLVAVGPSLVTTGAGMFNPNVGIEESNQLGFIFHHHLSVEDQKEKSHFASVQHLAHALSSRDLPDGSIIMDTFMACGPEIDTTVPDPRLFVITNDRDFERILADPLTFHTPYLLVPEPVGDDALDAINRAYPELYRDGTYNGRTIATLTAQYSAAGLCPPLRLYKITAHPTGA